MSRTILAALCACAATAAVAQPAPTPGPAPLGTPPAPASQAPPPPPSPPGEMRMDAMARMHQGLGPSIRLKGPGGAEVSVRCASGESTRACSEVVGQLLERAAAVRPDRRRDDDDDMPRGDRYRDRDRDRY